MKILVIDDENDVRELLKLILNRAGHTVFEADNGKMYFKVKDAVEGPSADIPKGWGFQVSFFSIFVHDAFPLLIIV